MSGQLTCCEEVRIQKGTKMTLSLNKRHFLWEIRQIPKLSKLINAQHLRHKQRLLWTWMSIFGQEHYRNQRNKKESSFQSEQHDEVRQRDCRHIHSGKRTCKPNTYMDHWTQLNLFFEVYKQCYFHKLQKKSSGNSLRQIDLNKVK